MTCKIKIGGAWKDAEAFLVKVGGAWKPASSVYVKESNTWRQCAMSTGPDCIDLPAGAAAFLAPYASSDEAAATARDPHDVYPRGPKMPISFFSTVQGTRPGGLGALPTGKEMMLDGILTWQGPQYGSGGTLGDLGEPSGAAWLRANNIKGSYHIRPLPKNSGETNTSLWSRLRTKFNTTAGRAEIEAVVEAHIRDMVDNYSDVVSSIHLGVDDYENGTASGTDYNYFQMVYNKLAQLDPLKRPAVGSFKGDRSLNTLAAGAAWMPWLSTQHYIMSFNGYSYVDNAANKPLAIPSGMYQDNDLKQWWFSQYRSNGQLIIKKALDAFKANGRNLGGGNYIYTGLPSSTSLTLDCYRDPQFTSGKYGPESVWDYFVPKIARHDLFAQLAAGAEGIVYYTWQTAQNMQTKVLQYTAAYENLKALTQSGMSQALMWGKEKGGVTVLSGRTTCPAGWGPNTVVENAASFHARNVQHGDKRYILAVNSHPVDAVKFKIAGAGQAGLKMVDIFTGSRVSPSGSDHTVTLQKYEVFAVVVEPADGYCGAGSGGGGGTSPPASAPVITTHPRDASVSAGDRATFTVSATGATSWQWQYQEAGSSTWVNASSRTSTYTTGVLQATANGTKVRCVVSNSAGSVNSNAATITIASAPAELVTNGDFSAGTDGWTAAANSGLAVNASGQLVISNVVDGKYAQARQLVTGLTPGGTYRVSFQRPDGAGNSTNFRVGSGWDKNEYFYKYTSVAGTYSGTFTAPATGQVYITIVVGTSTSYGKTTVDNVSIQAVV